MENLYNEVLVSYDIENNQQRSKLFNKLKDMSLTPIQKSVFWGHLNRAEERSVTRLLKEYCLGKDKAFLSRVNLSKQIKWGSVGYKEGDFPSSPRRYHVI